MERCYDTSAVDIFREPARVIIAGFSNSGKSTLTKFLIEKYESKFSHIIYCGTEVHPLSNHPTIKNKISFHKGIVDPLKDVDEREKSHSILYVLDDLFVESVSNPHVVNSFTRGRHFNLSVVFVTQNMFYSGKHARNIAINASHYILHRTRDISQVETLGRQIYGREQGKNFMAVYKEAVLKRPFGYLLVDLALNTPQELQLRSHIVGEPPGEVVFLEWQT